MNETKRYLGDGAYVDLDGFGGIVLTAENGIEATDTVVLEPDVLLSLLGYITAMQAENLIVQSRR